jgi:hypothetical protein
MGRTIAVPCFVDIEQSPESLHAHAVPQGIEIRPGDTVLVHGAPARIAYGESLHLTCAATVVRATAWGRMWAKISGLLELADLYEVGFQPKESA